MSKGTIIYIGGFELPDKNAAAHRVFSNGKIIRELGYNAVFIYVDKSLNAKSNILETKKVFQNFECWAIPYPESNRAWLKYLTSIDPLEKVASQYNDIKAFIAYNYQAAALYKLIRFCRKQHLKVFADCTEWYSTKGTNIFFKIIKGFDSFFRMRVLHKKLDGLIVISKYLEKYYKTCKNVIRIPPLVDLSEEKWTISFEKFSDNKIRFIYSGNPGKNKDRINSFIEELYRLRALNSFVFNVVGIEKEQYLNDYPDHLNLLNELGNSVLFSGRISHIDSIRYLKQSDFSIFIRENSRMNNAGFPTKFVESISCGTPVITTKTSNLEDYLIDGKNGFFINSEVQPFVYNIINMTPGQIKLLKEAVNTETFSYKLFTDQFDELLNQQEIYEKQP